jgi:microcystin-dependent protein
LGENRKMSRVLDFADGFETDTQPTILGFPASDVAVTPAGDISSTNVQDALEELDAEKVSKVSSTENAVVRFDDATGAVQDSGVIVDDSNNVSGINDLDMDGDLSIAGGLIVDGDLTVEGTTTTLNTQTLDVEDLNITVNIGGNDVSSEGAGITVDRTGTSGSVIYANAAASKFKIGDLGSEVEVATLSHTQTLSNKTLTSPVLNSGISGTAVLDEDDMASNSDTKIATQQSIKAYIAAQLVSVGATPPGVVLAFAGTSTPTGYLACDGTAVSRATYSNLFTAIGVTHGQGDGSTTFNTPDYRGRFLRGVDGAIARDPDRAARTAMATGGNTGDNVGSVQLDAMQGHRHNYNRNSAAATGSTSFASAGAIGASTGTGILDPTADGTNGTPRTTSETRPLNAYVNFIIKT